MISFTAPVPTFTPNPFPIAGRFLIAPFWADVDTRGTGEVYFMESRDETLLTKANDIIKKSESQSRGLSRYEPTWILIATWFKVGYFSSHTDKVVMCILHKYTCNAFTPEIVRNMYVILYWLWNQHEVLILTVTVCIKIYIVNGQYSLCVLY